MNTDKWAALLDGREYRDELTREECIQLHSDGLVAVYGGSDDLVYVAGAGMGKTVEEEMGASNSTPILFTPAGLFVPECECDDCPHERKLRERAKGLQPRWCAPGVAGNPSWSYTVPWPHTTFNIMEDGEVYCVGVVFALEDVPA